MKSLSQFISHSFEISEEHLLTSWLFIKLLAIIYFIAFLSLAVQIPGLVGPNGIMPLQEQLDYAFEQNGYWAFLYMPTVFWVNSGDIALQLVSYAGCFLSVALFFGYSERKILIILFILYLSLFHAGQTFLTFQWDTLLMEAGFLAIFLTAGPSHLLIFLFHWLLFRLRFMSGLAKLLTEDPSWANLTTLNYYFETQPLPHVGSWYFNQLPEWLLQAGVLFTFFTELIVPFFIFLPRKFRIFAAVITIFMQLLIIASSNHNWINLLTIVLCLFVLDDRIIRKIMPGFLLPANLKKYSGDSKLTRALPVFAVLIITSSVATFLNITIGDKIPGAIQQYTYLVRSWGIGHAYHIFPTMQTERQELQIEGSYDGKEWKAYQFKYKPGPLSQAPKFNVPHQPRLDWMMWFVPPRNPEFMYFFGRFLDRLEQGSPQVLDLLDYNPFGDKPPKYTRVLAFKYEFTNFEERRETGNWWKYEYLGEFPNVRPRRP
ncbi:MAG: lipase maturation factor family protein [Gammaproteobacteria bacterium]|nr:lipase maturation factor family protein [Gammaproteobacteria bacterium]